MTIGCWRVLAPEALD